MDYLVYYRLIRKNGSQLDQTKLIRQVSDKTHCELVFENLMKRKKYYIVYIVEHK